MAQAPELGCISTNQDKIWCVNAHLEDVDSYQILSGLVEKPLSYNTFNFYYKIANLLNFIVREKSLFCQLHWIFNHLYSYILLAFFDTKDGTPPTVLALGPWNFHHMWPMVWGFTAREDFWIPPPQPAPGSKRCTQCLSVGPFAYLRAFFTNQELLEIVKEVIYFL